MEVLVDVHTWEPVGVLLSAVLALVQWQVHRAMHENPELDDGRPFGKINGRYKRHERMPQHRSHAFSLVGRAETIGLNWVFAGMLRSERVLRRADLFAVSLTKCSNPFHQHCESARRSCRGIHGILVVTRSNRRSSRSTTQQVSMPETSHLHNKGSRVAASAAAGGTMLHRRLLFHIVI